MGISGSVAGEFEIVTEQELLITDVGVVDNHRAEYPGAWSFGHLMEQAYGAEIAPGVVATWLDNWAKGVQRLNSSRDPRPGVREKLIKAWQKADGWVGDDPEDAWRPKFENAPFRLLAIVNRMDMAVPVSSFDQPTTSTLPGYYSRHAGAADSAGGEMRLVFGVTDQRGESLGAGTTVIFE